MQLFERNKSIRILQADNLTLEAEGHLKDRFHEIRTYIVFDCESKAVLQARAEMVCVPFNLCPEVCDKMSELVGIQVKRGISKWVQEIVGGPRGCAHLYDLVMDSFKAVVQAADYCMLPPELSRDEKIQKIQTKNMGICHTYSNLNRNPRYTGNEEF